MPNHAIPVRACRKRRQRQGGNRYPLIWRLSHVRNRRKWADIVMLTIIMVLLTRKMIGDGRLGSIHRADNEEGTTGMRTGHPAGGQESPQDHRDQRDVGRKLAQANQHVDKRYTFRQRARTEEMSHGGAACALMTQLRNFSQEIRAL